MILSIDCLLASFDRGIASFIQDFDSYIVLNLNFK